MNTFYLQAHECYPSRGNRVLHLLVNRELEAEYAVFERGLLPALHHFGLPYTVFDLAKDKVDAEVLEQAAAIVLAHDGVASALGDEQWESIVSAVRQ
ncbi:MAG: hypothetical protein K0Q73_7288, partial [Paenibacillus sp.]|nr:hypothetical protein [Paenibacillus sp.]